MSKITDMQETLNQPAAAPSADATPIQEPPAAPVHDSAPDVAGSADQAQDAKPSAETSAADDKDANKRASLLDVVKAAYEEKPDSESSTEEVKTEAADAKNAEGQGSLDDARAPKDGSQKPADKVPFHNHPRWKEIVSERDALKPKAEQFEKITTFMQNAGLSAKEMADGMQVMAMMKTNPQEAYKALKGYVDQLAPLVGEVLPEDIKRKVDDGFVDPDTARELARLKAERELADRRSAELNARAQAEQAANQQRAMHDAVAAWEETEKAKDPDWTEKYEMVMDRARVLLMNERPSSPSEAVELARRALAEVNSRLRPALGRNQAIRAPASSLSSANTRPKPASLEDLVRMGLNT